MKIVLKQPITIEKVKQAIDLVVPIKQNSKNVIKHFGKLKRGIDGIKFQSTVRNEWKS
ncbi:MAG: hypothetical protein ACEQSR_03110 [Candidatus Methylacidiphilales bacterium]